MRVVLRLTRRRRAVAIVVAGWTLAACSHTTAEVADRDDLVMARTRFVPAKVRGSAGQQLTLRVVNNDRVRHNFSLPSVPIDLDFKPGERRTVILVAPADRSEQEFFCKFHRDAGMRGTLVVAP
ncbi:MAG: cupredoxin domain-containing protein [Actinobacteria bacterium]|nr:cupredoxin domain-containing protein [Actinomycetota bacterium]